jgi:hypothetical protein
MIISHYKLQDATIGDKKYEKPLHYYYAIQKKIIKWVKAAQADFG